MSASLAPPSVTAGRWTPYVVEMGALLRLGLPLVLAMIGQVAIMTTDMLMLGWLGPQQLAATALALSAFHPLMLLGIGIGTAVTPLAAAALARHDLRETQRVVRHGLWAALPFTLLVLPVLWWAGAIFTAIGQDPALAADAQLYLRGVAPGLLAILAFNVFRSYATALERTRLVLVVTAIAVPLNAVLNYGLIFGSFGLPRLEILGAGIGSSLINLGMALAMGWLVATRYPFRRHGLFSRPWRLDRPTFRRIHKVGVPIGLFILLEVGLFAASAQIMGLIGVFELAAHQIAVQLASITFMVPLGIGQAATARVAIAQGRGGLAGSRIAGFAGMALAVAFMSMTALLFWFAPRLLAGPFLDGGPDAPRVLALASSYLALAAVFQIADGLQVSAAHALRGLQDTRVPLCIAIFGYWLLAFPTAVYLGLFTPLQGAGVWSGILLGLAVAAILLIRRFHRLTRPHP